MRLAIVASVWLVGCGAAPHTRATAAGPITPELASWIPADAALVIGGDDAQIDALARALAVQAPGELIGAHGLVWIMFDEHTFADCARVAPGFEVTGARRRVSGDAVLFSHDLSITVVRGTIACTVKSKVGSLRERRALELATLAPDEELIAREDARAALAALPPSPVWAWGSGEAIGGGFGNDAATAMAPLGELAVAVSIDPTHALHVALRGAATFHAGTIEMGAYAEGAPDVPLRPATRDEIPKDDNGDVPLSAAYDRQLELLKQAIAEEARVLEDGLQALGEVRTAWLAAWGRATVTPQPGGADLVWPLPAWPLDQLRATADRTGDRWRQVASDDVTQLDQARALVRDAVDQLIKIRAADVAAYDRDHRAR